MATQSITLDGATSFSAFDGGTFNWSGLRLDAANLGVETATEDNTLNIGLSGPAWRIRHLGFFNETAFEFDLNISDTNDGVIRRLERIELAANSNTTITLFNTRVDFILGDDGGTVNLTLGSQRVRYMDLWATDNTITMGSGNLQYAYLGQGINVFNVGTGFVEALSFGNGSTNTVTGSSGGIGTIEFGFGSTNTISNGGEFGSIRSNGNNTFTFLAGGDALSLGSGISTVNLTGGFYGSITSYSGTNTINVGANADVRSIGFSGGVDVITVDGFVEQIQVGSNNDRVTFRGEGGAGTVSLGSGNNTLTVDGTGYVGSVVAYDGADRLTLDGGEIELVTLGNGKNTVLVKSGQIGSLQTYDGADKITVQDGQIDSILAGSGNNTITTGSEWTVLVETREGRDNITIGSGRAFAVRSGEGNDSISAVDGRIDFVEAGDGNDTVTLGALSARFVVLGDGDDVLSFAPGTPTFGIEVQGDGGVDTIDLSRFTANLTLDLSTSQWQNPAGVGGTPAQGYLAMIGVENAIGGTGADAIAGSEDNNLLTGGRGADTLSGGDGNDTLVGGRENDVLTGGLGADTFTFLQADGRDVITDFADGTDRIELREANALGDLTITQNGADVRIDFGALRITVLDALVAEIADAGNFLF